MLAETCSVYLLISEYTLKIDVVLTGFLKFLLLQNTRNISAGRKYKKKM
jgi:hypothetical protein